MVGFTKWKSINSLAKLNYDDLFAKVKIIDKKYSHIYTSSMKPLHSASFLLALSTSMERCGIRKSEIN